MVHLLLCTRFQRREERGKGFAEQEEGRVVLNVRQSHI